MEIEKTKKCPKCEREIFASDKKCKHCQMKIRNWIKIIGLLAFFIIIIGIEKFGKYKYEKQKNQQAEKKIEIQNVNKSENIAEKSLEENKKEEKIYKMKEPVPVGYLGVQVLTVDESKTISDGFIKREADGIYKMVGVVLVNVDKEAHYVDSSMFKLVDNKGRKFDSSSEGNMMMSMKSDGKFDLLFKQMNPSVVSAGIVVFDIPEDVEGLKLEVSGGFLSLEKKLIELQ